MNDLGRMRRLDIVAISVDDTLALASCVHSVERAAHRIREKGWRVRPLLMLQPGQPEAAAWLDHYLPESWEVVRLTSEELGAVRREALGATTAGHVAMIDGTDIWCAHWLDAALDRGSDEPAVWRPQLLLAFGPHQFAPNAYEPWIQRPGLDACALLADHHYRSGFIASREVLDAVPYPLGDNARGWSEVDWCWNCDVAGAGFTHHIVPLTFHYRRRGLDQLGRASSALQGSRRIGRTTLAEPR